MSQLWDVTCHMKSGSVTCQQTQVNTPHLNPSQTGRYSIYLPRRDGRVSWPWAFESPGSNWSIWYNTENLYSSKEYKNKTLQYDAQMNTLSLICTQWRRANYNWWPMTEYTMISTACFNSILSISNTVGINCKHCFGFRQTRRIIDLTDASFTTTLPQVQPAKQFNK